jgi:hypothetical protein
MGEAYFVIHSHQFVRFGGITIHFYFAAVACVDRQRATLVKARGPEPTVETDRRIRLCLFWHTLSFLPPPFFKAQV